MFQREIRYTVLKHTDIRKYLSGVDIGTLESICAKIAQARAEDGKQPLVCAVVESDWPEYEPVWQEIQSRVEGEEQLKHLQAGGI